MKSFRFYFVLALLAMVLFFLMSPLIFGRSGVVVTSVSGGMCGGMREGDIIIRASENVIKNSGDFDEFSASVKSGVYYPMIVNGGPGGCTALADGSIGVEVSDMASEGIKFDKSIVGGVEVLASPKTQMSSEYLQKSELIMRARLQTLKMSDTTIELEGGKIAIDSPSVDNLGLLIKPARLEGTIRQVLEVRNNKSEVKIGTSRYTLEKMNSRVIVNGSEVKVGQTFYLSGIGFTLSNITNNSVVLDALIFENIDIIQTIPGYGGVSFDSASRAYRFTLPVQLSATAGKAFGEVSDGLSTYVVSSQTYLNGVLRLHVDGEMISELGIPVDFAGTNVSSLSLIGFGASMNEALVKQSYVEVATAGSLPGEFKFEKISSTEPTIGWALWAVPSTIGVLAALGLAFQAVRKKGFKFFAAVAAMLLIETAYMFGVFAIAQKFVSWYIDAYTLLGVCALLSVLFFEMVAGKTRTGKFMEKVNLVLILVGVALLFTPFRGMGITLFIGIGIDKLLTRKLYSSAI